MKNLLKNSGSFVGLVKFLFFFVAIIFGLTFLFGLLPQWHSENQWNKTKTECENEMMGITILKIIKHTKSEYVSDSSPEGAETTLITYNVVSIIFQKNSTSKQTDTLAMKHHALIYPKSGKARIIVRNNKIEWLENL